MKSFFSAATLVVFLPAIALGLTDWGTTKIDARVSVQAPAQLVDVDIKKAAAISSAPDATKREAIEKSKTTKYFLAKSTGYIYGLLRVDGGAYGMPESVAANPKELENFYDGYIKILAREDRGEVISSKQFTISGMAGRDSKHTGVHVVSGKKVIKYNRTLLVGNVCYTMQFTSLDPLDSVGVSGQVERTRFYNSIVIRPKSTN